MKQVFVQRAYMKRTRFCEYDMKGSIENYPTRIARVNAMGNTKNEFPHNELQQTSSVNLVLARNLHEKTTAKLSKKECVDTISDTTTTF